MFRVVVKGRRDAKAVRAAVERFAPGWGVRVEAAGGAEAVLDALEGRGVDLFAFALLGRREAEGIGGVDGRLPPFAELVVTRGARVRNNTVEMIASYLSTARARVRLRAVWSGGSYVLARAPGGLELPGIPYRPSGDNFLLYGRGAGVAAGLIGAGRGGGALLLYKAGPGGMHYAYSGPSPLGALWMIGEALAPRGARALTPPRPAPAFRDVVEANRWVVDLLEEHAVEWLRSVAPEPRRVIVPWSGGKDSTAALLVAVRAYGPERVTAVYVDTGVDFPENREYVEENAARLGVDLVVEEAGVDRGLLEERLPLPSHEDRWCTGRKLEALRRAFKRLAGPGAIVVTGDRDAESERRSRRPPLRRDEATGLPVASPLKLWGGAHTQVYVASRGLPLNPLYEAGFYRIGCYICFSLRSWEIHVMRRSGVLERILRERPHHAGLVRAFLRAKRMGLLQAPREECGVCGV